MPIIQLDLDSSGAVSGLRQYESEAHKAATATDKISKANFTGLESRLGSITNKYRLLAGVITGLAGSAVAMLGKSLIMSASDMEETQGKFNVVFKGMTDDAEAWADSLSKSYGMSIQESHKYLASMQDLLVPMGLARSSAGKLSNEIVKLATDMGSFNNVKTADVMADIQSAIVGNYETMKKYGVVLTAAKVEQEAYALGLSHSKDDLTTAAKAQAAYSLMVKGSKDALGDFSRTQGSFANQLKIGIARINDIATRIGQHLLPMVTKAVSSFVKWTDVQKNLNTVVAKSITVIQFLANGLNGINIAAHGIVVAIAEMANIAIKSLVDILEPLAILNDGFNDLMGIDHIVLTEKLESLKNTSQEFTDSAVDGLKRAFDSAIKTSEGFDKAKEEALKFGTETKDATDKAKDGIDSLGGSVDGLAKKLASAGDESKTLGKDLSSISSSGAEAGLKRMSGELLKEKVEAKNLKDEVVRLTDKLHTLEGAQKDGATAATKHTKAMSSLEGATKDASAATKDASAANEETSKSTHTLHGAIATTTEGIRAQWLALKELNRELDAASKDRQNSTFSIYNPEAARQQAEQRAQQERSMHDAYIDAGGTERGWYYGGGSDSQTSRDDLIGLNTGATPAPGGGDTGGESTMASTTMTNNTSEVTNQVINFNQQISADDVTRITASLSANARRL